MSEYVCKYGLYHDKPCIDKEPRSNNGWIYSAFAHHKNIHIQFWKLEQTFHDCWFYAKDPFIINRIPYKHTPPISRDEIIGMTSLGFDPLNSGWSMYNEQDNPSYLTAISGLWKIRSKHRNYFWENEMVEVYPIAMKLWWHDRHYINKMQNKSSNLFYWFMFQVYALATILQKNISAKNVLTLQLEDLHSKFWIRFINKKENYSIYFGKDHPFNSK